jgi:hypothetical protein
MNPVHPSLNGCRSTSDTLSQQSYLGIQFLKQHELPLVTNETQIRKNVELASDFDKFRGATNYRK